MSLLSLLPVLLMSTWLGLFGVGIVGWILLFVRGRRGSSRRMLMSMLIEAISDVKWVH